MMGDLGMTGSSVMIVVRRSKKMRLIISANNAKTTCFVRTVLI